VTTTAEPEVSGIVVTYESRALVPGAIDSLRQAAAEAGRTIEIIVVDNASADGTADTVAAAFPEARLVRNPSNDGFGRANNRAFELARGRWWILLNPDARLAPGSLRPLLAALEGDPGLAAVGPSIGGAGTEEAESAGALPSLRSLAGHFLLLNRAFRGDRGGAWRGMQIRHRPATRPRPVEWLSAAAMAVRPEAICEVGGFDPSIFMYGEDMELGWALLQRGWRLALLPTARADHQIGGSQAPTSTRWIDGIEDYLERRGRHRPAIAAALLIIGVGLAIRAVGGAVAGAGADHRARMRAGAGHALRGALRRALGRGRPAA
jgi:GT2 family glycosyltransferase